MAGRAGVAARGIAGALVTAAAQAAAAPRRGPWWRRLSESVAKTRVAPKRARRNADIPRFFSRPIPARSAFATDLDTSPSQTVPGAPLRVSPSAWCHRWRRGTPAQRFRGSAGGPPNREGYSGVVLKAWCVRVVVAVCSGGGPPRSKGCCGGVRVRLPGVMRGVVEGGGVRGSAVTVRSSRPRVRWGAGGDGGAGRGGIGGPGVGGAPGGIGGGSGAPSPLRPTSRPVWWNVVSHAVTSPGSRARHLTREIVT